MVVGVAGRLGRVNGERAEQPLVLRQRQRGHRAEEAVFGERRVREVEHRVEQVRRAPVREHEADDALARRDRATAQDFRVAARHVLGGRVTLRVVVEIDGAQIERDDVADLVDENGDRVLDVERRAEGARNLVERVNLAVRARDLAEVIWRVRVVDGRSRRGGGHRGRRLARVA